MTQTKNKKRKFFCKFTFEIPEEKVALIEKNWSIMEDQNLSIEQIMSQIVLSMSVDMRSVDQYLPKIEKPIIHSFDDHEGVG
jgi:hypothetical protein